MAKGWARSTNRVARAPSPRRPGRPGPLNAGAVPGRCVGRKSKPVEMANGVVKRRKGRQDATRRLRGSTRGDQFDLSSKDAMERFCGGQVMPGIHIRHDLARGRECSIRCQICYATGTAGRYGHGGNMKTVPRAKHVCTNLTCGGLSFCSMKCDMLWHVHPNTLNQA